MLGSKRRQAFSTVSSTRTVRELSVWLGRITSRSKSGLILKSWRALSSIVRCCPVCITAVSNSSERRRNWSMTNASLIASGRVPSTAITRHFICTPSRSEQAHFGGASLNLCNRTVETATRGCAQLSLILGCGVISDRLRTSPSQSEVGNFAWPSLLVCCELLREEASHLDRSAVGIK